MPFGYFIPVSPGHSDNSLPGMEGPTDPGYGHGIAGGIPGNLPVPPPGIWPPPSFTHPIIPISPDNSLPVQPGTIWPKPGAPERPSNELPGSPSTPDNSLPTSKFWVVAGIPGIGWRYVCVDPSLTVGNALPTKPPTAGQPLPPNPAPKT